MPTDEERAETDRLGREADERKRKLDERSAQERADLQAQADREARDRAQRRKD